jgi:hypothetical protein
MQVHIIQRSVELRPYNPPGGDNWVKLLYLLSTPYCKHDTVLRSNELPLATPPGEDTQE